MKSGSIALALGLTSFALSAAPITLDFSKSVGEAPLVYGLARPPSPAFDRWTRGDDLRKANIPYLYMHNVGGAYGSGAFVDISNLFPKFDADADDPASYDFMVTDNLMQCMIRNKLAPIFRLGESEEEMASVRRYRTFPPKDAAKWACICEHVIRHYNEGWDNGFKYDIDYWPIWHAPDRSTCWAGTMDEFVDFYAVASRHLKARFPRLKIGGAGLAGSVDGFVAAVKARGLSLDFLSFEAAGDAAAVARRVREVKAALAAAGLSRVELLPIVQPTAKPGTMRSAAEIAANLAMLANEGVKTAVTGERDCAAHHFSPFLDPLTGKWRPAFQSLVAFDRLYAYRERAAFENGAAAEGLVVTAVRDPFGGGAAMVVNLSDGERSLDLRAPGWSVVGAASFDEATDYHEMPLPKTIAPDRVVVVRFLKDDAERPVPLERADGFTIDFDKVTGPVKPVNGVGQAPMVGWDFSMFHYLKEADIPLSRFHDTGGSLGRSVFADVSNIFRDFDADENDPKNYDFAFTDRLVDELRKNGVKIYYRLGETIETRSFFRRYRTYPPKDYAKWARICEHIVRHYENDIAYLEIWNEPDGTEKPMYNGLWKGTFAEFLELYGVASKHLKKCFPHIKVGGYASTGFGGAFAGQPSDRQRYLMKCFFEFLDFCQAKRCPVDFFSFHCYGDGDAIDPIQRFVRRHLDAAGFPHAEIHNTEWKAGWGVKDFDHQAALTAGTLIAMQNGPMDVATIYDGRCGAGDYSPLFNPSTLAPHKAYYAFRMFAELRRDGRAVKTAADATAKLRLAASTDGHGRGHALVSNSSWKSVPLKLNAPGWKVTGCRALDKTHDDTEIPLPTTLAANQVLLLTLERDSQEAAARGSEEVRAALGPYVERGEIAGVVSVLSDAGYNETWDIFGWADAENKVPMRPDTMFAIFSMTKTFTGAALMCAIDDGVLSLDDPVEKFLPEYRCVTFADGTRQNRPLTLRDITSHMDGMVQEYRMVDNALPLRAAAAWYAAKPAQRNPGEAFRYGTMRFSTAAACLEVATGRSYYDYLKERILDPLGMVDTTFDPSPDQIRRMVKAYTTKGGPFSPAADGCVPQIVFPKKVKLEPVGGSGLYSTPADMIRFSQMLAHHGEYRGRTIISRKTFDGIFSVVQTPPHVKEPYTCGSWLYGAWFGHEGAMRTDQRANLETADSRVFFIQTENAAGKAFFDAKRAWNVACDKCQHMKTPFSESLVRTHENDIDRTKWYQRK